MLSEKGAMSNTIILPKAVLCFFPLTLCAQNQCVLRVNTYFVEQLYLVLFSIVIIHGKETGGFVVLTFYSRVRSSYGQQPTFIQKVEGGAQAGGQGLLISGVVGIYSVEEIVVVRSAVTVTQIEFEFEQVGQSAA